MADTRRSTLPTLRHRLVSEVRVTPSQGGWAVFIIVLASLTIRTISISLFLPNRVVSFVPDDALYYIGLAKNRVSTGNWTFDGTAPATGFHLLWGYILWYIYIILGARPRYI